MTDYAEKYNLNVLRSVGADSPVDEEKQAQGIRGYECWLCLDEDSYNNHKPEEVIKKTIRASKYLTLRIQDPFADPFECIPNGWKKLASIFHEKYTYNHIPGAMCFEEVKVVDGKEVMDIFIPFK